MGSCSRVALVTGGTVGTGAVISEALLAAGYRVAVSYGCNVKAARAFEARTCINAFAWNVSDLQSCMDGVARVQTALGPVDVLVNHDCLSADPLRQVLTNLSSSEAMDGELDGCFNMCRAVLEGMRRRHFGRIVNISSVNAWPGLTGYRHRATGKSGMVGLTRSLAYECAAHNITANAIAPGQTDTAMMTTARPGALTRILASVPAGRLATPAEVARGVVLLAADESAFINGVTLSIDGASCLE